MLGAVLWEALTLTMAVWLLCYVEPEAGAGLPVQLVSCCHSYLVVAMKCLVTDRPTAALLVFINPAQLKSALYMRRNTSSNHVN